MIFLSIGIKCKINMSSKIINNLYVLLLILEVEKKILKHYINNLLKRNNYVILKYNSTVIE